MSVRVSEVFQGVLRGGVEWERRRSLGKWRRVWRTWRGVEVVGGVCRSREEEPGVGRGKWGSDGRSGGECGGVEKGWVLGRNIE